MGNFAENLNLGNRFRPPLFVYLQRDSANRVYPIFSIFLFVRI